jgi:hemerythrin
MAENSVENKSVEQECRREQRYTSRAYITVKGFEGIALIRDINTGGFCLASKTYVEMNPKERFSIKITPETETGVGSFEMSVEVRWTRSSPKLFAAGFSILGQDASKNLDRYIVYLRNSKSARQQERQPAYSAPPQPSPAAATRPAPQPSPVAAVRPAPQPSPVAAPVTAGQSEPPRKPPAEIPAARPQPSAAPASGDASALWDESLATGNELIDSEHKELLNGISEFFDACSSEAGGERLHKTIRFVNDYTIKHFHDEEALQVQSQYPNYESHKQFHESYKKSVHDFMIEFIRNGVSGDLVTRAKKGIGEVLIAHIKNEDIRLAAHIRAKAGAA